MISVDAPLETVPMFVRAGAIIPTAPPMNYTGEKPHDPITFNIYPDATGKASTSLYEDDGSSPAYKQDVFRRTAVTVKRFGRIYSASVSAPEGSYKPGNRKFTFIVRSALRLNRPFTINDNGKAQTIRIY